MSGSSVISRFLRIAPPVLAALLCCAGGLAQVTTVFPASNPRGITVGPDGAIWFTDPVAQTIGRIDANGAVTAFPTPPGYPSSIVSGSDGNLWYTDSLAGSISRMTTSGIVTEFTYGGGGIYGSIVDITLGPDGNLWFTDTTMNLIGRITTSGVITQFPVLTAPEGPGLLWDIAAGPDGNLWFTEPRARKIGRITTSGTVTEFALPRADSFPYEIVAGPDGNLWFSEDYDVGRITPTGDVTYFPVPVQDYSTIAAGTDGNLWIGSYGAVSRMTSSGAVTVFPVSAAPDIRPAGIVAAPDGSIWIAGAHDYWDGIDGQIVRFSLDTSACVADATTLCLNNGRFRVTADWKKSDGSSGQGSGVALTADSGYFWFFNASNIELVAKVLNACSAGGHYWAFAAGLTNVEVTMTVTDTYTGVARTYTNPLGSAFAPIQDTSAFATCP